MTDEQIAEVERIVNTEMLANQATKAQVMAYDEAVQGGAMALFGEKYGDTVRVLDIGFSRELCGGTHVARTGDIGLFKIVSEGGVRSEEHTSELQSLMRISYAVFCLKKKKHNKKTAHIATQSSTVTKNKQEGD